jgi:hypothetical protein
LAVHRSRWTDERLDELAARVIRQEVIEAHLASIDARLDRSERDFAELRADIRELRGEMGALRSEVFAAKRWVMGLWVSSGLGFAALIVQIALNR